MQVVVLLQQPPPVDGGPDPPQGSHQQDWLNAQDGVHHLCVVVPSGQLQLPQSTIVFPPGVAVGATQAPPVHWTVLVLLALQSLY